MDVCVIENGLNLASGLMLAGSWLDPNWYLAVFKVILGLGAVIFVHELGHFLLAKACGVKCDKFYVGFDAFDIKIGDRVIIPRRLVHWTWGETEYGIGILPFGGYVKMLGQDDNPGNLEEEVRKSMKDGDASVSSALTPEGLVDRTKIDPRSYLAKSVPQRMAIISAGVIFNLIFAVFFAAYAFRSGVDFPPPKVGNVIGSGPAWEENLAGATFEKVGNKDVRGYFSYTDLAQEIGLHGGEEPIAIQIRREGASESTKLEVTPKAGFMRHAKDIALLGFTFRYQPVIGKSGPGKKTPAAAARPEIKGGDRIVEIDGQKIETDLDVFRVLATNADREVEFVLERSADESEAGKDSPSERITTKVAPNPMRVFGFTVEWLPISNIQKNSPAEVAGLQTGDEIISIDGQPRGDLLMLEQRMIRIARDGGTSEFEIKRNGETQTLSVSPTLPSVMADLGPNTPLAINSLGVAIPQSLKVETVDSESEAAKGGLSVGDELVSVEYLLNDEQLKEERYKYVARDPSVNFADDDTSWAEINSLYQSFELGSKLKLEVRRGSERKHVTLATSASADLYRHVRGIPLESLKAHYKLDTWKEASIEGCNQVYREATRVLKTFRKLVTGRISPKNLGGPGTIAVVATSEASQGTSNLLLFLTFLSANLAVVNFLPIPVLDGGHMLFLAYEGIFRRPVNEKTQALLTYVGLAMILTLMIFVVCLDATRIYGLF